MDENIDDIELLIGHLAGHEIATQSLNAAAALYEDRNLDNYNERFVLISFAMSAFGYIIADKVAHSILDSRKRDLFSSACHGTITSEISNQLLEDNVDLDRVQRMFNGYIEELGPFAQHVIPDEGSGFEGSLIGEATIFILSKLDSKKETAHKILELLYAVYNSISSSKQLMRLQEL